MMTWSSICERRIYRPVLAALLASTATCSSYEAQGQFWPASDGPLLGSGGVATAQGGSSSSAQGGSGTAGSTTVAGMGGSSFGGSSFGGVPGEGGSFSVGGTNAAGGSPSTGGASSQNCSLSVTVTTTAPGGQYAPRNVGAIWVADSSGRFVKSLEVWGAKRISHVVAWNASTKSAGAAGNKVDAITSATLSAHRTHNATWNCRDFNEQAVPDGSYRVYFEVADSNSGGPNVFEPFTKSGSPSTVQTSMGNFNGIVITFTP